MPSIYQTETLELVWEAINNDKKPLRQVANELNCDMGLVNRIYQAAHKRFYKKETTHTRRAEARNNKPVGNTPIQRPPAVYSNRSPYGIARPGIQ